ncbi:MAG: transposase, partial [archaeon]|nr:transposase [archaeon]
GALRKHLKKLNERVKKNCEIFTSITQLFDESNKKITIDISQITEEIIANMLIDWVLEGKKEGNGYGFPFDRIHYTFYKRLKVCYVALEKLRYTSINKGLLGKLWKIIGDIVKDRNLKKAAVQLQEKTKIFDKLRKAMRITLIDGKNGLNDHGDSDIITIKQEVEKFTHWLKNSDKYKQNESLLNMTKQIDKYGKMLFADPIKVKTKKGYITVQPQRTNNISERFFRDIRRKNCKKTGNDSLTKTLKAMNADTPLVKNLENDEYLELILNRHDTIEQCFAEVNSKVIKHELDKIRIQKQCMSLKMKKIVKIKDFPKLLTNFVCNCQ